MTLSEKDVLSAIERILGPNGLISTHPGYTFSAPQYEYACRVGKGLIRQDGSGRAAINALQAATGTGKTIGYLVPLFIVTALTGNRGAVSTYTRQLQLQVMKDAAQVVEWVAEVTSVRLTVAQRMGRNNYVCPDSCEQLRAQLVIEQGECEGTEFIDRLIAWATAVDDHGKLCNTGLLADFLHEEGLSEPPMSLRPEWLGMRTGRHSKEAANQAYEDHLAVCADADIMVCNHALLAVAAIFYGRLFEGKRPLRYLICDEADRMPQAAEGLLNADLTLFFMASVFNQAAETLNLPQLSVLSNDVVREAQKLNTLGVTLRRIDVANSEWLPFLDAFKKLANGIKPILKKLAAGVFTNKLNAAKREELMIDFGRVLDMQDTLDRQASAVAMSWSPIRAYPSLRQGRANAGHLYATLFNAYEQDENSEGAVLDAVCFTSATLATPGVATVDAFKQFLIDVGVKQNGKYPHYLQTDLFERFEPIQFGQLKFVVPSPVVENPTKTGTEFDEGVGVSEDWVYFNQELIRCAHKEGGRVLVLTGSYADVDTLTASCADLPIIAHKRGTSFRDKVAQFEATPDSILCTPSGWEGLNLPGLIKHLVITKIPYGRVDSVENELMELSLARSGMPQTKIDSIVFARIRSRAMNKLAQGIGRPIRHANDRACVWIGDPRFPLPEQLARSITVMTMATPRRRINKQLVDCIPKRFRTEFEKNARIALWAPEKLKISLKPSKNIA